MAISTVAVIAALALTSCGDITSNSAGPAPSTVRRSIVDIVDSSTAVLGGQWVVYSGPSVEACGGVPDRARYVYIMDRVDRPGDDPTADLAAISALWKKKGIDVSDYESGGTDPLRGLRGVGGPTTSIGFDAFPDGYSITAVSDCADGNVNDLRRSE
ncbi:hypothetical protein [Curtobacterium herbarum]|uniref:hypothetical protein n=1 Tax=Curtobacterium herbarum TaxID=150122 RepID=UPI0019573BD8|nr:hypothetical protein [Curtobacterium herbarum]MBM7473855.1 hypothetical protein [Curtobacterium herbarum]